jgi:N-acetylglucosamine-6-phosphate deacetylase
MPQAFIADKLFTGDEWLQEHAILVSNGRIEALVPALSVPSAIAVKSFGSNTIIPSLIDLQIYGAYGKLLAVYPETGSLAALKEYCEKGGAAFSMPTVATNTKDVFLRSIDAVRQYQGQGGEGILGLHLEGPWINPVKKGAHIESLIHNPTISEVNELLEYGEGIVKMITLAPEVCSKEVIDLILSHDIVISAGHSNASYDEAISGFEKGISTATHLYNAMSPLQHRAPGLVGAVMDHRSAMCSIIPDGHHVDFAAIRIAKQVMKERLFVITDAVTDTTTGYYPHYRAGDKYESDGILSGSALTMDKAMKNLVDYAGISIEEAIRMCSLYPARVIKRDHELGKIKPGYLAKMAVLGDDLMTAAMI